MIGFYSALPWLLNDISKPRSCPAAAFVMGHTLSPSPEHGLSSTLK